MSDPAAASALSLKDKGDLAELMIAADLRRRGHGIAIPFGEAHDFDLILIRGSRLERVQVKYTASDGVVVKVRCRSHSLTGGKVRRTKHYTPEMIDLLAVYDETSARCYYVPATELGAGRSILHLRLRPTLNGQRNGTRRALDYVNPPDDACPGPSGTGGRDHGAARGGLTGRYSNQGDQEAVRRLHKASRPDRP